jgi:hypothetical protein
MTLTPVISCAALPLVGVGAPALLVRGALAPWGGPAALAPFDGLSK